MKQIRYTLVVQATTDDLGNNVQYVFACCACLKYFTPTGQYTDDHAQVIDDIISHECKKGSKE